MAARQGLNDNGNSFPQKIILLLFAASFFFGTAVIFLLPPFEGIDETAHFSRMETQAFAPQTDILQKFLGDKSHNISSFVADYYGRGPMPYGWITAKDLHIGEAPQNYITYHDFFAQPALVAAYTSAYWQSPLPADFAESPQINWEYQHPPLYYALTSPVLKLLGEHASLITSMLVLRMISYILASLGLSIGLLATQKYLRDKQIADAGTITAYAALYPFFMPVFIWAFARLGNDSLCLLLFGLTWAALLWHLRAPHSMAWFYLSIAIAACWLTKAFMIPAGLGILVFLLLHHRSLGVSDKNWWHPVAKIAVLLALFAVPTVFIYGAYTSSAIGSSQFNEAIGKIFPISRWFDVAGIMSGLRGMIYSFYGVFGTWSAAIIAIPFFIYKMCFLVLSVIPTFASRKKCGELLWLPAWIIGPVLIGIIAHVFVTLIIADGGDETAGTPGYYLHVFSPALALWYGAAIAFMTRRGLLRKLTIMLGTLIVLFDFWVYFSNMTMFSGCAVPDQLGQLHVLGIPAVLQCLQNPGLVVEHLNVLAWPEASPGCILISMSCLMLARVTARRIKA